MTKAGLFMQTSNKTQFIYSLVSFLAMLFLLPNYALAIDDLEKLVNSPKEDEPNIVEDVEQLQQSRSKTNDNQLEHYEFDQLANNPRLFSYYINQLISARNLTRLQELLPYYKKMPNNDPLLVQFADALLYDLQGNNKKAIAIYKKMLANDPSFHPVRLQLALSLMDDKQYKNAKSQLIKLKSEELPQPIINVINAKLHHIDSQETWKFTASGNYVHDKNINNAPSKKFRSGFGTTTDPIEAHGIHAYLGAYKKFHLKDNFYNTISGNINGNLYWNVKGYNDYSLTGATSVGYTNEKHNVELKPFVKQRIYDDKPYSRKIGVTASSGHWVNPKTRLSTIVQYGKEKHKDSENKNRDSNDYLFGVNGFYTQNSRQYFFGGLSHYRSDAKKSPIISHSTNSAHIGWGKEWQKGISSTVTANYSQKQYDNPSKDPNLNLPAYYATFMGKMGSSRTDKTRSISGELWKRDYAIAGLTPKLVINYNQTDSNFAYYDDKKDLSGTVELTTNF